MTENTKPALTKDTLKASDMDIDALKVIHGALSDASQALHEVYCMTRSRTTAIDNRAGHLADMVYEIEMEIYHMMQAKRHTPAPNTARIDGGKRP